MPRASLRETWLPRRSDARKGGAGVYWSALPEVEDQKESPSPYRIVAKEEWYSRHGPGANYEVVDTQGKVVWKDTLKSARIHGIVGHYLIYLSEGPVQRTEKGSPSPIRTYWHSTVLNLVNLRKGARVDSYEVVED